MENYVAIYLENKKIVTHATIKSLLEKLPSKQFIQTHKSYVIASDRVDTIEGNTLHIGQYKVPMSKYLRDEVLGQLVK
jgi:DNA-binding LytR/AlgR family response regulator